MCRCWADAGQIPEQILWQILEFKADITACLEPFQHFCVCADVFLAHLSVSDVTGTKRVADQFKKSHSAFLHAVNYFCGLAGERSSSSLTIPDSG